MEEKTGVIYKWTCNITGKSYIGQTTNERGRYECRVKLLGNYTGRNHFYSALNKYSNIDDWEYSIIENDIPKHKLNDREVYWISYFDTFNNGYNMTIGGGQVCTNWHLSDEHKEKLRNALKDKKIHTEEFKQKLSKLKTGRKLSEETKQKLSNHFKGKKREPFTDEHRKHMSEGRKGMKFSEEHKKHISESQKGRVPWNKGKRKIWNDPTNKSLGYRYE